MIHSSQCSPKAVQISLHCSASVSSNNICDRKLKVMGAVQAEEKWYKLILLCSLSARAPQQIFINATVTVWLCHPNRLLVLCGVGFSWKWKDLCQDSFAVPSSIKNILNTDFFFFKSTKHCPQLEFCITKQSRQTIQMYSPGDFRTSEPGPSVETYLGPTRFLRGTRDQSCDTQVIITLSCGQRNPNCMYCSFLPHENFVPRLADR